MDRRDLVAQLLDMQGHKCFIGEEPLDPDVDKIEVDHIIPRAKGGKDDENNYAAVCERHNRTKSDSDLRIARCLAKYEEIKEAHAPEGPNRPNLGDFLAAFGGGKCLLRMSRSGDRLTCSAEGQNNSRFETNVYKDKLSTLEYAFMLLPIEDIHHDSRINPRAVGPRIRGLISEFLDGNPQLHVALAWGTLKNGQIKVAIFDGQHKAVAQMLLGVRKFAVRLFICSSEKDEKILENVLLEANTHAGTTLRQIAFDQATQRFLGSQLYWEKIDAYKTQRQRPPDDLSFSEQDLVSFFRGERREVARYILDDLRIGIIHHPQNKLKDYVEFSGKEGEKPLSYSTIEKTVFSLFINKAPLSLPLNFKLEIGENPRQLEKDQIVRLLNVIAETIYIGKYDFDVGANRVEERLRKGDSIPDPHLRAVRMSREEVLYNVLWYIKNLVKRNFLMRGQVVDDSELFDRTFPEELWSLISKLMSNIANLPVWVNRQISGSIFGGKQDHEYWKIIFETGRERGGVLVLAKPLNLDELIT
jgi:HNH endonuclease